MSTADGWRDLDQGRRGLTPVRAAVGAVLVAGIALVSIELASHRTRAWLAERPATVTVAVGLLFLVLTVFLVERWLASRESARWRTPAIAALDAYVHSADQVAQQVYSRVYAMVEALPAPADVVPGAVRLRRPEPHIRDTLQRLVDQDAVDRAGRVLALSSFIREQTNQLAVIALVSAQTVARHEPFSWVVENIATQQTRLADAARICNGLEFVLGGFGGSHDETYRSAATKAIGDIEHKLQAFVEELHTMRAQLDEAA